ncbi:centrosomal protein of 290 kDa isoform X2 [Stegostoma tigrinum]|uniref:centrosomal protein of 290 kDa isoform X2 n=1 Tax=Stegostoma tigrinum TaxID=3053191 RepID=UPI00202B0B9C|nr:centrosomal protein of 290 kDa isoform X2 [Stegostoma tigrinum]
MAPSLDWVQLMKVDPDSLPSREKLADKLLDTISKVEGNELTTEDPEKLIQLFRLTQSLMKMKAQEVELALEEVEKAGEEQAKTENQLKAKVLKLENELEMAQVSAGGRDTRFLREELRQVENQLQFKDREVSEMEKELNKEKKIVEQVGIRIKEIENENNKLRRENDQLRQDVVDYQKQIDSQRETLLNRRGDDSDCRIQLSKKNKELAQYLDEIQNLSEANEKLEAQNKQLQQKLEESVQEMDKMTDEYNKMKLIVQQSDSAMDQFKREKGQLLLQVQDLTNQLQATTEEDDPVMLAVNAKIEEWKKVLSAKDKEISEYQQKLQELRTKLVIAEFDSDKSSVITLQQVLQERDDQIKALVGQIEQYTKEANHNVQIIEDLKMQLEKESSFPTLNLQSKIGLLQQKTQAAERKAFEAKRMADLAERDAREKDKELAETLIHLRAYESGIYGLENAVAEIKECKNHIKIRDHQIEAMTKEINKLEMKINDLLDENENFRQRLGLDTNEIIDLSEFRKTKYLKQQQFQAENQVLLKEIERLEEERLVLKRQIRRMAQDKGMRAGVGGISAEDLGLVDSFNERISTSKETELSSSFNFELNHKNRQIRGELLNKEGAYQNAEFELAKLNRQIMQNEYISRELEVKEKELEETRTEVAQLNAKLKKLVEENKQFESGMKDILQAIKSTQVETISKGGEEILKIESLEKLVTAIERKNTTDKFNSDVHLKAQLDQLMGRNDELRQELKEARKEAGIAGNQLAKAIERITNLESELTLLRQSGGCSVVFQPLALPEGIVPSSIDIINTLNEYLVQLLQEISNKEKEGKKLQEAAEDHKRKFAVIRHQQGLLYKEYQSERESWQRDIEKVEEEKKKLEDLKQQDQVKIEQYNQLLETLQVDPDEMKKKLAELTSKLTVLRVNESSLTRRYTTLMEMEKHLRKENNKLKNEIIAMEAAVSERIGYLQRFKDMASFKIAALQKALDESAPISDLERANKQYNELTAKYRDLLQKDNLLVQKTTNLEHLVDENTVLREQISALNKELEITKEKQHTLEQALEEMQKLGGPTAMDKERKAITNSEIVSISKKITMLEMKELNERQRAEHAQKMYEHVRDTLKQVEERNSELESKFAEVTKINLEAQRVEQNLRDELANSVSQTVSNADRSRITELEKSESELKVEASKLRDIADVAKMQVAALEALQQSREKEVEALRKQVLDYQAQSDERALIATLHQHIIALQVSEATAVSKLQAFASKLQKMEACNLRLMQKLDEKDQTLFHTRLEGTNKAKHLRQTIQSLRRQFSGALPLAQQEKFSKTMMQLQDDKLKIMQDGKRSQEERRVAEDKALELQMKLKGLEELIGTLKDAKGAQKVIEWHKKIEELRLQDLKTNRSISKQKEEITYLNNIISELEHTINNLEEETVQQNKLHEERQIAWDRRELELQHQLDTYEHQHNEILNAAQKFEEATGSVPDPNKPLPQQLNVALQKIREHVFIILETQATCKTLEKKLKEKEASLWKAEQNVLSRDQVINELRLRLPATAEREKLMVDLSKKTEDDPESRKALKVAHQTIANLQARLDQKEEVLQKYQQLLTRAHQDQEEIAKKHEEDLKVLHLKLNSYADASLNKFKQSAMELMEKPSLPVPTSKHLARLAELEQTVAEQDSSLSALVDKLKRATMELEKQKDINQLKVKEHKMEKANLEEKHSTEVKKLCNELDELRCTQLQMEKEVQYLQTELEDQKRANTRAPTATMKNLVDRLKGQLALKEKQQKALSKALLDLRAEMTSQAEQQIINQAAQKEGHLNVQQIVDKQTKELRARIEDLTDQLTIAKDSVKACKSKELATAAEIDNLNGELQKKLRVQNKLQAEKDELMKENEELKKKIKRLCNSLQTKTETDNKQSTIDELQKKVRRLECELDQKMASEQMERKVLKEDRTSKEEIVRWEEGKKWQSRLEGVKHKLKEKEKELETMTKQITTLKELYARADQEKAILQKKLKARGITADQVVGVRTMECNQEIEDLRRKNTDLQDQIMRMRRQQALPRDSVVEELTLKNQYLHEKIQALEKQLSKSALSIPSTLDPNADFKSKGSAPIDAISEFRTDGSVKIETKKKYFKKSALALRTNVKICNEQESTCSNGTGEAAGLVSKYDKHSNDTTMHSSLRQEDVCTEIQTEEPLANQTGSTADGGYVNGEQPSKKQRAEIGQAAEKEKSEPESDDNLRDDIRQSEVNAPLLDSASDGAITCSKSEPSSATGEEVEQIMEEDPTEDQGGTESETRRIPEKELQTSGMGADALAQKEQELQRENLRLAAENVELRFQLEQADKDLPRLKDQIVNLQEMYQLLKKEKAELERKLGNMRGSGRSGKTVPELEKTIGLMKKVVERIQRENEELKKGPGVISSEKQACLEMENNKLKSELEKLKSQVAGQLSLCNESKTKGVEKILAENERLRKELKKVEVLKHFPEEAKTEPGLTRELQLLRLTNDRLEKEKAELLHHLKVCRKQSEGSSGSSRNVCDDVLGSNEDKLTGELVELQTQLKTSDFEKQQLQEEIQQLKRELKNFDPSFFEELEDLKFNYNQEVKRNILLEEQLKKLAEQFGVQVTIPENISTD